MSAPNYWPVEEPDYRAKPLDPATALSLAEAALAGRVTLRDSTKAEVCRVLTAVQAAATLKPFKLVKFSRPRNPAFPGGATFWRSHGRKACRTMNRARAKAETHVSKAGQAAHGLSGKGAASDEVAASIYFDFGLVLVQHVGPPVDD